MEGWGEGVDATTHILFLQKTVFSRDLNISVAGYSFSYILESSVTFVIANTTINFMQVWPKITFL